MTATMTWVGLDVHARSTHAAAIDAMTGELVRVRFGAGLDAPLAWLGELPGPVRACYEAGPTGFGLYRAAVAAGIAMQVIAPGKTPRGPSDRVKTDRKDAELLARLLLAGSLTQVVVPPPEVEAGPRADSGSRRVPPRSDERVPSRAGRLPVVDELATFARASVIALSLRALATTTRMPWRCNTPTMRSAPVVASKATTSSLATLAANSSSVGTRVAIRPAERTRPSSAIATSQKSRCTSNPSPRTTLPSS